MDLILPHGVLNRTDVRGNLVDTGDVSNCTHPAGHCFGSDGGSGIPENLKVLPGRGGEVEAWGTDDAQQETVIKETYLRCQFCRKFSFVGEVTASPEE